MNNKLLGFSFFIGEYKDIINKVDNYISTNKSSIILTPTTEILYASYKDVFLSQVLNNADILLPDSITLVKLAKIFKKDIKKRITGIDTMYALGKNPNKKYKVFYLGAKQHVIEKAVKKTSQILPSFEVVGYANGYYYEKDENELVERINLTNADILFVGTGFPKQESFIYKHRKNLSPLVKITVGGSFDVIAGVLKRAPLWMQKLGIEWFFRLIQEPFRIKRTSLIPWELLQLYFYEKRNDK
jgi:N-acetylglucosaminyldiphosphoundecaprenol N-acetyl-beta-D-mannosaminyltransferase